MPSAGAPFYHYRPSYVVPLSLTNQGSFFFFLPTCFHTMETGIKLKRVTTLIKGKQRLSTMGQAVF